MPSSIQVNKIGKALGAEISGVDLAQPLSEKALTAIHEAWLEHLVLRFRGQKLSDPQLMAFSRSFGELDPPGPNPYGKPFLPEHLEVVDHLQAGRGDAAARALESHLRLSGERALARIDAIASGPLPEPLPYLERLRN